MELTEISSSLRHRVPFRPMFLWVSQVVVAAFAAWMVYLAMVMSGTMTEISGGIVISVALLFGLAMVHLWIRRCRRGAAVVDWNGIKLNGLFHTRRIPWSMVIGVHQESLTVDGHGRLQIDLKWIAHRNHGEFLHEIRRRWRQSREMSPLNLPSTGPELKTARLVMAPWRCSQWQSYHRIYSESSMLEQQGYGPLSPRQSRRRFKGVCRLSKAGDAYSWHLAIGLRLMDGGLETIGHLDFWVSERAPATLRLGYGLFPEYRGHGYMTEALASLAQHAQQLWGIVVLEAGCLAENQASCQVLERVGFRHVSTGNQGGRPVRDYRFIGLIDAEQPGPPGCLVPQ